jgi:LysM repeat protein/ABC-type branched-subunit amino acid transport system substrate-binding protein
MPDMQCIKKSVFLILFLSRSLLGFGQSDFKVEKIDGKKYYLYTVEAGNTVYAISKKYSIEIKDIIAANPSILDGLSIGQKIKIPVDKVNKEEIKTKATEIKGSFLTHTVQNKETLYAISKRYGVDANDILETNPEANSGIKKGQILKIPSKRNVSINNQYLQPVGEDSLVNHKVEPKETFFSISKKYSVSVESLKEVNKNLPESEIKVGNMVRVPILTEKYAKTKPIILEKEKSTERKLSSGNTINVALLLPFSINENDSILRRKTADNPQDIYLMTDIALDFYRGAMIAIDSLKNQGITANVYVYDVGEDVVDARQVIKKPELKNVDLIIGPMHKASLAVVSEFAKLNKIHLISINSHSSPLFDENPYLENVNASSKTQIDYMANYVLSKYANQNIILVNSKAKGDEKYRNYFINQYNKILLSNPKPGLDTISSFSGDRYNVTTKLKKGVNNIIIAPSTDLAFVSDFMTKLSMVDTNSYKIIVYGLDNWMNYDNVDIAYKSKYKLHFCTPSFVDYDNTNTIDFIKKYRMQYKTDPGTRGYGFQGFDITYYYLQSLLKYGLDYPEHFSENKFKGLQTTFDISKSDAGKGFENKNIYIVKYGKYKLNRVY